MKEQNIKNRLAENIKKGFEQRKICASDSENEIGRDHTPVNWPDEFFEVAIESPKIQFDNDEFFSTKGDSELNVTKILPHKIFTSLFTTPLRDQCLKLVGQTERDMTLQQLSQQSSACNSIDLGSFPSPKSDKKEPTPVKIEPETKSESGGKQSPSRIFRSLIKGEIPQ